MDDLPEWLQKAENDLEWANITYENGFFTNAGFVIQQACEKVLKYFLLSKGWKLKKTHDLTYLINESIKKDPSFSQFKSHTQRITQYYAESRYPPILSSLEITQEEIREAYTYAQKLIKFIKNKTGIS